MMTTVVRNSIPRIAAGLLLLFAATAAAPDAMRGTLSVELTGVHSGKGVVRVALWRSEDTFMKGRSYQHLRIAASGDTVRAIFQNLAPGEYAVSAFQDENSNGKLDLGFLARPKEPYGFSNDASGTFGPPDFRAAAFTVKAENKTIALRLK